MPSPSSPSMSHSHSGQRPSFINYWRKQSRDDAAAVAATARTITFVQTDPSRLALGKQAVKPTAASSSSSFSSSSTTTTTHKSLSSLASPQQQHTSPPPSSSASSSSPASSTADPAERTSKRRAQVRRAQIQHRQRKANYVKQLEADIADMRQQIADAERARRGLAAENQDMRARFAGPSTSTSTSAVPAVVLVSGGGDDGLAYGEEEEKADDQLVHSQEHRQMETEPYPFAAASPSLLLAQQQQDLMLYPAHPSLSLQSAEDLLVLVLQQQQQQQQKQENYFGAGVAGFQMGLDQTLEPPHLPLRKESDFFSIPVSEQELHNVFPITTTTATTTTISTNYFDPASSSTSSTSTMTAHSLAAPAGVAYQAGYPSPSLQYHQFIDSSSGMGTGMGIETETETHTETPAPYLYPDLLEEVQQQQRNMGGTWDSMDYVFS